MTEEKKFKTKTGYCYIHPNHIELTRNGKRGKIAQKLFGNSIQRALILYSIIALGLIYVAVNCYLSGKYFFTIYFGIISVYLILSVIKSINNSATSIIYRNKIREIKYLKAKTGITRACFVILFVDEKEQLKKRLVFLPGSLNNGAVETEKALALMREEGLINA
ncbi:phosphoribosylaminoimidazolesuccinocarboxamide synthase [Flavobacterium sp. SUN046]|uniref:phosphoribosylaminoimidazolesuccinocarboxamide synthase n=1 Tax=Flavobacterium sp. SUN046 TaxID=3002440 RepID=UPI002DB65CC2|nr:phosphoribosylaminoimidazolesuccinocarboxamide synthase [Flavobacterium sp. SUN046]MEC4048262.1 phosphoribosylaminoimidazolesuccinocarboxamide synthase [Flavobacterium sp. SUN046]